jgi:hypothetical protein
MIAGGFEPRVVALRQGQDMMVNNLTAVGQVLRWTGANNLGGAFLPAGAQFKITGLVAEGLPICLASKIALWSNGRVAVFAHPYFAVTDVDGAFEVKDAPVGKCRLVIWNETYNDGAKGRYGQQITIPANNTLELGDIAFTPPAE